MNVGDPLSTTGLPRPAPDRGIFETLLVADGRPVELDAHLDRLAASARELYGDGTAARIAGPARALALARAGERALSGSAYGRLRLTLAPDGDGRLDLSAASAAVPRDAVFPSADRAPALAPVAVPGGLGAHKWADRRLLDDVSAQLLARQARSPGPVAAAVMPLIVDDGSVLEAERANVFAVADGVLVTPPLDGRILPGVTRARTVELAGQLGIPMRERALSGADLDAADELFLTGSVRGIEPLRAAGDDAPVTARLAAALRARWL